jgi:hypothetical protein
VAVILALVFGLLFTILVIFLIIISFVLWPSISGGSGFGNSTETSILKPLRLAKSITDYSILGKKRLLVTTLGLPSIFFLPRGCPPSGDSQGHQRGAPRS